MARRMSLGSKLPTSSGAAQKATRHRAESHKAHAQFPAGLQHRNFGVACPQRVLGLQRRNRVHRMRAAQGGCRHL